ncbi:hypothetical protein [Streptomyces sp. NPDC048442]|uniref:hypothetical protein n=1 Tax=Streptomyces sp. NPDC048442 TaxID=3154823 RepID=UPI00342B9559
MTAAPSADPLGKAPWHNGAALMDIAFDNLDPVQRSAFILQYFRRMSGVDAVVADMRGNVDPKAREALAGILQQVAAGLLSDA